VSKSTVVVPLNTMSLATVVTPRPNINVVLSAKVTLPVPNALLLYTPMVPALTLVPPV
jgi:hypothetical protein